MLPSLPRALVALAALAVVGPWATDAGAETPSTGAALVLYVAPPSDENAHAAVLLAASRADLSAPGGVEARPLVTTLFGEAAAWPCDEARPACADDGGGWGPDDLLANPSSRLVPVDDLVAELIYGGPWNEAMIAHLAGLDRIRGAASVHLVDEVTSTVLRLDTAALRLFPVAQLASMAVPPTGGVGTGVERGPTGGPVLLVVGGITAAIGLAAALDQRSQGLEIYSYVEQDPAAYDASLAAYEQARRGMASGLVVAGIGGALAIVGIPVWAAEARRARGGATVTASPVVVPGQGGGIVIEGRW